MGGLLFGFNTSVISGALSFLRECWNLDSDQQEWITTAVLIGTFLDAITGGRLADKYGCKKIILLTSLIFAVSLGLLGWPIISEGFPAKNRGLGVSTGAFSNWFFNAIVAFTFLKLAWLITVDGMQITQKGLVDGVQKTITDPNPAGAFFVYSAIALLGIIWGWRYIPETKCKSLEDIEKHWREGDLPNSL